MIRKALVSDINDIYSLGIKLDPLFNEKNNIEEYLNNNIYDIYVYEFDNKIIGFIMLTELYETMELLYIIIDDSYQHCGYGRKLVEYAINNCNQAVNRVILEVRSNNNQAISFYNKNNFKEISIRKNYYDNEIDAIIMERSI